MSRGNYSLSVNNVQLVQSQGVSLFLTLLVNFRLAPREVLLGPPCRSVSTLTPETKYSDDTSDRLPKKPQKYYVDDLFSIGSSIYPLDTIPSLSLVKKVTRFFEL